MNLGKLLGALIQVARKNPSLVISAVRAIAPIVKEVKAAKRNPQRP